MSTVGHDDGDTAWHAAFVLGIAFSQPDDASAVCELEAVFTNSPNALAPTLRYLACLASADEGTRRRALALIAAIDGHAQGSPRSAGQPDEVGSELGPVLEPGLGQDVRHVVANGLLGQ